MSTATRTHTVLEAHRWWTNGDHPRDAVGEQLVDPSGVTYRRQEGAVVRFYRHPHAAGEARCVHCWRRLHDHGWLDGGGAGEVVCPGDWIVTGLDENEYHVCKPGLHDLLARRQVVARR